MTIAQQLRIEGFRASLGVRGFSVSLNGQGSEFTVLIEPAAPVQMEHSIARETARASHISVLRSDLPTPPPAVGDMLEEGSNRYRITAVDDNPTNPVVIYRDCEVST